jgi:hypothetical protein
VLANQTGILIYGVNGPSSIAFQGGFLYVAAPTTRTPLQTARALGPPPCTGRFSYDFNGRIASGIDPALTIGRPVWTQYWMRDIASPSGTGLTEGLSFVICQ